MMRMGRILASPLTAVDNALTISYPKSVKMAELAASHLFHHGNHSEK